MRRGITLIPRLFSHWWEVLERPHQLFDQHFGRGLRPDQLFSSVFERPSFKSFPYSYYRSLINWERDEECGWSIMKNDKDRFQVILDVRQFKPKEVGVKVVDNFIIVEGKHEDRADDHGLISRHFVKKYLVPDQCDPERATSTLSTDGILTITAPLRPETIESKREKTIKIEQTGKAMEDDELLKIKQKQ
ncbi:protein lethal(2)essential for life-like [Bombus vancouverensis nearcticus]|uniref:Protein lethal(2)essential for life-like n=1 Tax=Bombus bifarius TaxID=103933 RepID=A0A6P8N778_9HYME|nr:protein lethal(2)essential for life-like [Bombus vancouverensis nearcticus]XP_033310470.1 protein lethal(2)essential for life-like [Bombus bifarius]